MSLGQFAIVGGSRSVFFFGLKTKTALFSLSQGTFYLNRLFSEPKLFHFLTQVMLSTWLILEVNSVNGQAILEFLPWPSSMVRATEQYLRVLGFESRQDLRWFVCRSLIYKS